MFEFLTNFLAPMHDPSIGAVGDISNHCPLPVEQCGVVSQFHQGQIVLPKSGDFGQQVKVLNPVHFKSYTQPQFLNPTGPSVSQDPSEPAEKIFAFTARVDPDSALVDGVRIDWSAPPDAARVLVSPNDTTRLHEATGWVPTKADGRFAGGVPQTQNIIFSHPEWIKKISVQMRDAPNTTKTQFGIQQVALITNEKDLSKPLLQ